MTTKTSPKYRSAANGRFTSSPATKMKRIYSELYRAFDHFNKIFTDNSLPKPVITIQESGRKNAYGWFGKGFWYDNDQGAGVPEINISAEYLSRGVNGVLETLLHEMAHFYNAVNEIKDCSSGQYHNKHFKRAAEMFGLKVERSGTRGYAYTSLTETSQQAIETLKADESLFKDIRRRKVGPMREKKYISLVVDAAIEPHLQEAIEVSGSTQKQFVQNAIWEAIRALD